jgi:hypothetical protein
MNCFTKTALTTVLGLTIAANSVLAAGGSHGHSNRSHSDGNPSHTDRNTRVSNHKTGNNKKHPNSSNDTTKKGTLREPPVRKPTVHSDPKGSYLLDNQTNQKLSTISAVKVGSLAKFGIQNALNGNLMTPAQVAALKAAINNPNSKLTPSQIAAIRSALQNDADQKRLLAATTVGVMTTGGFCPVPVIVTPYVPASPSSGGSSDDMDQEDQNSSDDSDPNN